MIRLKLWLSPTHVNEWDCQYPSTEATLEFQANNPQDLGNQLQKHFMGKGGWHYFVGGACRYCHETLQQWSPVVHHQFGFFNDGCPFQQFPH